MKKSYGQKLQAHMNNTVFRRKQYSASVEYSEQTLKQNMVIGDSVHTQKSFLSLVNPNQIWIVITLLND